MDPVAWAVALADIGFGQKLLISMSPACPVGYLRSLLPTKTQKPFASHSGGIKIPPACLEDR